jgi:phosphatidylserine decarboxylase
MASIVLFPWAAAIFALALLFVLWFFRDPERTTEAPEDALVSPADGKVVEIAEANEPDHIGGPARTIAIFMSVFDVHVNRAPCRATVEWVRHESGKFLNALGPQASMANERTLVALRREEKPVLLKLVAGLIARRIVCPLQPGDSLARGQRLGMIKFGSRVELFVARDERFEVAVKLGQHVKAGETAIGTWR